jgi:hypothetical protein
MQKKINVKRLVLGFSLVSGIYHFITASALAAGSSWVGTVSCIGIGCTASNIEGVNTESIKLVNQVLMFLTAVAAIWFLITIVWSGIKIIQSAKSPEDFNTHMKRIMWAAIGLIVVALAFTISTAVINVLFPGQSIFDSPVTLLTGA